MKWMDETLRQCSILSGKDVKWKDYPKWIKFKLRLMHFLWDTFDWGEIKKGWPMWRHKYKQWRFYKNHPYLK